MIAKELVRSFYSEAPKFNYFSGCSTGGRQAFKEVVLYPDDFDGLLAGAPAWWTTHLSTWTIKLALNDLPANAPYHIPAELFPVIEAEVLRQCDTRDGVVDNIITDPYECNFFPEALLCGPYDENQTECLSAPQIGTLYKIYDAYTDEDQNFVFPGETLGSEAMWSIKLGGSEPSRLGTDYVRYFLDFGADWVSRNHRRANLQDDRVASPKCISVSATSPEISR